MRLSGDRGWSEGGRWARYRLGHRGFHDFLVRSLRVRVRLVLFRLRHKVRNVLPVQPAQLDRHVFVN